MLLESARQVHSAKGIAGIAAPFWRSGVTNNSRGKKRSAVAVRLSRKPYAHERKAAEIQPCFRDRAVQLLPILPSAVANPTVMRLGIAGREACSSDQRDLFQDGTSYACIEAR